MLNDFFYFVRNARYFVSGLSQLLWNNWIIHFTQGSSWNDEVREVENYTDN